MIICSCDWYWLFWLLVSNSNFALSIQEHAVGNTSFCLLTYCRDVVVCSFLLFLHIFEAKFFLSFLMQLNFSDKLLNICINTLSIFLSLSLSLYIYIYIYIYINRSDTVITAHRTRIKEFFTAGFVKFNKLWDVTPCGLFWRNSLHGVHVMLGNICFSK
jgi:hypothetical protein